MGAANCEGQALERNPSPGDFQEPVTHLIKLPELRDTAGRDSAARGEMHSSHPQQAAFSSQSVLISSSGTQEEAREESCSLPALSP